MKVTVHYLGYIRNMLGRKEEKFEVKKGTSLSELLSRLAGIYGEPFKKEVFEPGLEGVKMGFVVTVNGVLMGQLDGVRTKLNEGDDVILMSLMSGG